MDWVVVNAVDVFDRKAATTRTRKVLLMKFFMMECCLLSVISDV